MIQELEFLRYPQQISLDSFDEPNFQLVADILYWLSHRFDTFRGMLIHDSIKTVHDRVKFITCIVKSFGTITNSAINVATADSQETNGIILDAKQLYLSMNGAVNEILKITSYLIDCVHLQTSHRQASGKRHGSFRKESSSLVDLVDMENVQNLRKFMAQLIEEGSNFYSSIMKHIETDKQNEYHNAIDYFQNVSSTLNEKDEDFILVQNKIHEIVESKKQEVLALEDETSLLQAKLGDAREALKNESRELERSKKRLQSLQSMEPAFVNDIDRLETDLQNHYDLYMERYRNLHYLKSEMDKIKQTEADILAESERKMKKLQLQLYEDDKQSHLESITDFRMDHSIVSPNHRNNESIRDKQFQLDEDLSEEKSGQSSEHSSSILISTGSTSSPSIGSEMFFPDNESPRHFHSNFHQYTIRKSERDDDNF